MEFLPGFVQGFVRVSISYPFDTTKVYMQVGRTRGMVATVAHIARTDARVFYRGCAACYTLVPADRSVQFYALERMNAAGVNPFASALLMSCTSAAYTLPMQYVCTTAVLTPAHSYRGALAMFRAAPRAVLYRGAAAEIPRGILSTTVFMGTYYTLRSAYRDAGGDATTAAPVLAVASSITSWCVAFPLDSVRTRAMTTDHGSVRHSVRDLFASGGVRAFYRGLGPVLVRTIPSSAVGMWAYEYTRRIIG